MNQEGAQYFGEAEILDSRLSIKCTIVTYSSLLLLKCCSKSTETVGILGTGAQDVHLDFHTSLAAEMELISRALYHQRKVAIFCCYGSVFYRDI